MSVPIAAAALLMTAALFTDIRSMTIPNVITVFFFTTGFMYHIIVGGWTGLLYAAGGAAAGFIPLLALHLVKGIGAGDVKLFGALGAWIGVGSVLGVMLYAILYAGLIGVVLLVFNRPFCRRMMTGIATLFMLGSRWSKVDWPLRTAMGTTFPFMLAAAPGAITALLVGS